MPPSALHLPSRDGRVERIRRLDPPIGGGPKGGLLTFVNRLKEINVSTVTRSQQPSGSGSTVRPFRVEISDAAIDDLRGRLARTRWPEKEPVGDWSMGIPLAYVQELAEYWEKS